MSPPDRSVNARAAVLVERLVVDAASLRIAVARGEPGETVIDAGSRCLGSIAAGLRIAEICMGGLGTVELVPSEATSRWPWTVVVRSSDPVTTWTRSPPRSPGTPGTSRRGSMIESRTGTPRSLVALTRSSPHATMPPAIAYLARCGWVYS